MSLQGKTIAVVGSGGDLGRYVCNYLRDEGATVDPIPRSDVDARDLEREHFMGVGGLVICHGAPGLIKPSVEIEGEEFRSVIDIDLVGTFMACRAFAEHAISDRHESSIVIVSSMHAIATYPMRAAYAAAKAGVVGLAKALAIEWAKHGITVNCVLPGQIEDTRRTEAMPTRRKVLERSPSGKLVSREAVSQAIAYLLTAKGVNGHSLVVDEGWTVSGWPYAHS